jgi:hypothetical protein
MSGSGWLTDRGAPEPGNRVPKTLKDTRQLQHVEIIPVEQRREIGMRQRRLRSRQRARHPLAAGVDRPCGGIERMAHTHVQRSAVSTAIQITPFIAKGPA